MRVAVCGAGIAGLALAERMSALGAEVVLVERSPGPPNQGAMIDLFGAGYEAADAIGILDAIRDVSYSIGDTGLVDELGRRRAGLPYGRIAKALEDRLCRITRTDLHKVLLDNLPTNVDLRFGTSVSEVTHGDDRAVVTLDDGARLDVDLLVGADGIHSTVRALAFGAEAQYLRYLGFHFAAFVFDASDMDDTAGDHVVITDTVDRQLGLYALRNGQTAVFAAYRAADPEPPPDARAALRDRFAGMGWLVPEVLERCPPSEDIYFGQVAQVEMPRWSTNRVVLVGDACSAVSPLTGPGASLALAGAYVLSEQLRRTSSVERALDFYERLWRPTVEEKQESACAVSGWMLSPSSSQLSIRRAGLRFTWRPLINRFVETSLAGEPTAVIAMLRQGMSDSDSPIASN
ncbi:FAD-dependent oxidoreductase [Mycobacterium marinum]|uniref:FAD-dependent monooxygenase n=1 Tax=Mycobacterium marinum TaxID=1781 RepID=UPI0021C30E74|nr:FAD-dependent monooxygenase [Mycobacterium marinum]GJO02965.1 FAD-dependent oxidoreductase [Mycobacterium marinum]